MNPCFVKCPECKGEVWIAPQDGEHLYQRKIKCILCDDEGMAHIDDLIDYYAYMSPDKKQRVRWETYKEMNQSDNPAE